MKAFIREYTPKPLWNALSSGKGLALDLIFEWRAELVPPRSIRGYIGDHRGFLPWGYKFLAYFKDYGGLKPDHRVLDVGCGIGRMAIPLTKYLSKSGSYEGIDVVPVGIKWCSENISPRYPNFRFQLADIYNKAYNPSGRLKVTDFIFPFDDASFDFVFLTSVFTHMLPQEVKHYLSEIGRVLKPGRRCLITWFLLNDRSKHNIIHGKSSQQFTFPIEGCLTTNPDVPEDAIAYEESDVMEFYSRSGITLSRPIHYGSWSGRKEHLSYQDICIGHKNGPGQH
jgi:SAM-dependent methyltransferase